MKQEMMGWQWLQWHHTQIICTWLQTDNHTSTFLAGQMLFLMASRQCQSKALCWDKWNLVVEFIAGCQLNYMHAHTYMPSTMTFLPPPRRLCFRCYLFVCLFFCLLATLCKNFQTDLHEIFTEGWQSASEQMIKFWCRSRSDPDTSRSVSLHW